jgi:hypothetical protein
MEIVRTCTQSGKVPTQWSRRGLTPENTEGRKSNRGQLSKSDPTAQPGTQMRKLSTNKRKGLRHRFKVINHLGKTKPFGRIESYEGKEESAGAPKKERKQYNRVGSVDHRKEFEFEYNPVHVFSSLLAQKTGKATTSSGRSNGA